MSEQPMQKQTGLSKLPKVVTRINPINLPKNGISNAAYAKQHNISKRQASKQRMSEKHGN